MAPMTTVVGLIMGSIAAVTIAVSSNDGSTDAPASVATARVVRVIGEDFKFDAPDAIPAGLTEFRFLNKGPALHHMALLKLSGGKTVDDLTAALSKPGPLPAWAEEVGGPNAPGPGMEANATM